jgi:hypothetical protein
MHKELSEQKWHGEIQAMQVLFTLEEKVAFGHDEGS